MTFDIGVPAALHRHRLSAYKKPNIFYNARLNLLANAWNMRYHMSVEFIRNRRFQLAAKDRQIEEKDRQIAQLQVLLSQQQELHMKAQQVLEAPKHKQFRLPWKKTSGDAIIY